MASQKLNENSAVSAAAREVIEKRSLRFWRMFNRYLRWYLRRNLHQLLVLRGGFPRGVDEHSKVVVYMNHPSWWDPILAMVLADRLFPSRAGFAPMDARAMGRYSFFQKLGVFGIELDSAAGARRFLEIARGVLTDSKNMLWITAEGHFTDPRVRPVVLRPGVGHLAKSTAGLTFVPLAMELAFWEERTPEVLVAFGEPTISEGAGSGNTEAWTQRLAGSLEQTMDRLAAASITRDAKLFEPLFMGRSGVGGVYDGWQRVKAWVRGQRFDASHAAAVRDGEEAKHG